MVARKSKHPDSETQHDGFKELARALGCEEDDPAAFEAALKKLS